jgi:hypothetical protein
LKLKKWRAEMGENPKHNFFDIRLLMLTNRMHVLDIMDEDAPWYDIAAPGGQ